MPWTYIISGLKGEEIVGKFWEKDFQKTKQKKNRIKNVVKRKDDKLYIK